MLLLSFFVSMIWQGRSAQASLQKDWGAERNCSFDFKSSALELLFHGLDKETLEQHSVSTSEDRTKALAKEAKRITTKLVPTTNGLKLSSKTD